MATVASWAVAAYACACSGGADGPGPLPIDAAPSPDAYVGPSAALFEVPRPGSPPPSGFYALPFPNDLRVDADGRIDFSDYKVPQGNALVQNYLDTFTAKQRGFSINAAAVFRFSDPIDVSTLPRTPDAARADGAAAYLVNVDSTSARRGERVPLRFRFERFAGETIDDNWLSALPYPGFPLEEQATYAAVVTTRVRAPDGTTIATSADFDAVFGATVPTDPALARAQALYRPLLDMLDEPGGDERADVVSAAVFTTADVTSAMGRIRETTVGLPVPKARGIKWLGEFETYIWYDGVYDAPNYQSGEVPYTLQRDGGEIEFDPETGRAIVQRTEQMRFSVSVPQGDMPPAGWPVVIYAHGTGGSYHTFRSNNTAARMGARGIAVVGIDQVLHGPRNPGSSPEISFFNFQNPLAARDSTRQGAADNIQLLRLIAAFDFTERHPGGRTIRFDADRVYFMGHSQGGLTGPPWLAYEPLVRGAVLSGAGGLIYLSLLNKTEPVNIPDIIAAFIRDVPLDEFNPFLALIQMWLDPADPVSYGPLLVRSPPPGRAPIHIYQSEGFTDRFTPNVSIEALATSIGGAQVAPVIEPIAGLELRDSRELAAPVTGNANGTTAVLLQYDEQSGSDGHFVVFDIGAARIQHTEFIATLAETGVATVVEPTGQ